MCLQKERKYKTKRKQEEVEYTKELMYIDTMGRETTVQTKKKSSLLCNPWGMNHTIVGTTHKIKWFSTHDLFMHYSLLENGRQQMGCSTRIFQGRTACTLAGSYRGKAQQNISLQHTPRGRIFLRKLTGAKQVIKIHPPSTPTTVVQPDDSLPCSQQPTTGYYSEQN